MDQSSFRESTYREVTKKIIKQIERGTKPWTPPWLGADDHPRNAFTKRHYTGINALILWSAAHNFGFERNLWLTARQANLLGGDLRPDARGTTIFFSMRARTRAGDRASMKRNEANPGYSFSRNYILFNVSQACGLPPEPIPPTPSPDDVYPRLQSLLAATGADIRVGGNRAFFDPTADYIQLPARHLFFDPYDRGDYGRTTLHELAHWATAPPRLNISLPGDTRYDRYAANELIAELAAAFASQFIGVTPSVEPANYIAEYLRSLKAEAGLLLELAPASARVSDHILSFDPGP